MEITFIPNKKIRCREKDEINQIVFIPKKTRTKNYILIIDGKAEFIKYSNWYKNNSNKNIKGAD